MKVFVAYAGKDRQVVRETEMSPGATPGDAVRCSGLLAEFPEIEPEGICLGIYGRMVAEDTLLSEGDRVEIYRKLQNDPQSARRQRAKKR